MRDSCDFPGGLATAVLLGATVLVVLIVVWLVTGVI